MEQWQEELREAWAHSELEQEQEWEWQELLECVAGMRLEQENKMQHLNSLHPEPSAGGEVADPGGAAGGGAAPGAAHGQRAGEGAAAAGRAGALHSKLEVLQQMEQQLEQWALRAKQKFQEGRRFLEHLDQMKREDHKLCPCPQRCLSPRVGRGAGGRAGAAAAGGAAGGGAAQSPCRSTSGAGRRRRDTGVPNRYCALVEKKAWGTASAATSCCHPDATLSPADASS
ncbi:involucrin-like [Passer montanus]|uniref:involucrin-like n=1 Tax=Passer montanus TaxID=9160 RepID=UPI00196093B7|nr:involucrin-like [Passer montanus]